MTKLINLKRRVRKLIRAGKTKTEIKTILSKTNKCECCGQKEATQIVRGVGKEKYCEDCALAYGRKNWVNVLKIIP